MLHHVLWALVARIAVVCCADLDRSLSWTDHCVVTILAICLLNLALWVAALVAYFANSVPSPSHPHRKWFMAGIGSGKFLH